MLEWTMCSDTNVCKCIAVQCAKGEELSVMLALPSDSQSYNFNVSLSVSYLMYQSSLVITVPPPPLSSCPFPLLSLTLCSFPCLTRVMSTLGKLNWPIWSPTVRSPSYSALDMNLGTAEALIWEREKEPKTNFTWAKPILEISHWGHYSKIFWFVFRLKI